MNIWLYNENIPAYIVTDEDIKLTQKKNEKVKMILFRKKRR